MDDFLHNLRSGKLKQGDRSNRPYDKGAARRNMMDRRKGHYDNKESSERLNAIKEVLEALTETQKRVAEAYQTRTKAEERKARALEVLAMSMYRIACPEAQDADMLFAGESVPGLAKAGGPTHTPAGKQADPAVGMDSVERFADDAASEPLEENEEDDSAGNAGNTPHGKLSRADRVSLQELIARKRAEGIGWENIARQISSQGFPTVSGKGQWRGAMVKSLYEKMTT